MTKRILHVVTNVDHYEKTNDKTGLWLSELSHAWDVFADKGFVQTIISPVGGKSPIEPRSLKWPNLDRSARNWLNNADKMKLLEHTLSAKDVSGQDYDAIYFTGGHAVMYDFVEDKELARITREIFESGGVVSSVCHGYCGLLNTRLSEGQYLISGRKLTGFSWLEEVIAGVSKKVPYNAEQQAIKQGANYVKSLLPFTPFVTVDGQLVTGQNPQSAKSTAKHVAALL